MSFVFAKIHLLPNADMVSFQLSVCGKSHSRLKTERTVQKRVSHISLKLQRYRRREININATSTQRLCNFLEVTEPTV